MSRRSSRRKLIPKPYRSWYEYHVSEDLIKRGIVFEYEQYSFTYYPTISKGVCLDCNSTNVSRAAVYTPDWYLPDQNIFIETKGILSASERKKLIAVRDQNSIDLRIMLEYDRKINTKKWERYSDWCIWADFQWAEGKRVPESWL